MPRAPINHGSEGGPWCQACGHWTEVDGDAVAGNVCVRCHRPGVVLKPPAWATRQRAKLRGAALNPAEVHALFEEMRRAIG